MTDVFVSYSRRDSEFVARLAGSVSERGKEVWLDTEGIADAEVFPEAIKRAIEGSDAFLFVITPSAVRSAYCENEVEYARDLNKRIVPVLREPVPDSELHAEIRNRNWIPFTEDAEFDAGLARLLNALDTDLDAVRAHTRWLLKALEWESEGRDKSFLLRGSELKSAEAWLASRPEDADPAPTQLQREYLLASREAAARRQRAMMGGAVAIAAVAIGLLIFALISRGQALSERVAARAQALAAESQAQLPNDPEISLILGVRAVKTQATPQTLFALRAALDASPLERGLPTIPKPGSCGPNSGLVAAVSPDGRQIAEGACNGTLLLLDASNYRVVHREHFPDQVTSVRFSPSGSLLAVGTNLGIMLLDPQTGAVRARTGDLFPRGIPGPGIAGFAFSPDGRELAANSMTGIELWSVPALRGRPLARYPAVGGGMVFTRNGKELVVGGYDFSFHIYDVPSGRLVRRVVGPSAGISGGWEELVALSPDGSELAVGYPTLFDENGTVSIYSTTTWRREFDVTTFPGDEISAVAFSPDGTRLAIGGEDGTAEVWSLITREELVSYAGPTAAVTSMAFLDGGRSVLTTSNDGVTRVWRALGAEQTDIPIDADIDPVALGSGMLSVVEDHNRQTFMARFDPATGRSLGAWRIGPYSTTGYALANDGRYLVTFTSPNQSTGVPVKAAVHIWSVATHRIVRTLPPTPVYYAALSPDDSRLYLQVGVPHSGVGESEVLTLATGHLVKLRAVDPCGYSPGGQFTFSANDARIAGASFCGFADVWDANTGRLVRQVNEGGEVSSVDLNAHGSRLLVGSWDSRATIWSVSTGHPLVQLIGHTRGIIQAAFADNASQAVTESLDRTVRVWSATTGQQLRVLTFPYRQYDFGLNQDGRQMAIAENTPVVGVDDIVRVFDTCPACTNARALLSLAAPHITNHLTVLEKTVVDNP
jgi:WD40 repeat protein